MRLWKYENESESRRPQSHKMSLSDHCTRCHNYMIIRLTGQLMHRKGILANVFFCCWKMGFIDRTYLLSIFFFHSCHPCIDWHHKIILWKYFKIYSKEPLNNLFVTSLHKSWQKIKSLLFSLQVSWWKMLLRQPSTGKLGWCCPLLSADRRISGRNIWCKWT